MVLLSRSNFLSQAQVKSTVATGDLLTPPQQNLPRLSNRFRAADLGGNSIATATSPGTFPGKTVVRDTVSRKDPDFFKLTFIGESNIRLTFQNLSKSTLVGSILNSRGKALRYDGDLQATDISSGKSLKSFYKNIPAGTYYLRIQSQDQQPSAYKLSLGIVTPSLTPPDCGCGV